MGGSYGWRWLRIGLALAVVAALLALRVGAARADDAGVTPAIATADITLTLSRTDGTGAYTALDDGGLATLLNATRCLCPAMVQATVSIASSAAATLGTQTADVSLAVGTDCDDAAAAACQTVGPTLTLTSDKLSTQQSLSTAELFAAIPGTAACDDLPSRSSRLWAIVRVGGTRTGAAPSLTLDVGAARPPAPSAVTVAGADDGLLVTWQAPADVSRLIGFQVLCSPAVATPPAPSFDVCAQAAAGGTASVDAGAGAAALNTLASSAVCSALVGASETSARIGGLTNGQSYQVAVVSIGSDGTPSAASAGASGQPAPTIGFGELYRDSGGQGLGGCAIGGEAARGGAPLAAGFALAAAAWGRKRRKRRPGWRWCRQRGPRGRARARAHIGCVSIALAAAALVQGRVARAGVFDLDADDEIDRPPPAAPMPGSSRRWNVELRFGPYRPAVDSAFADQGNNDRPYATVFGSGRRLMSQLELDRHLSHSGGTWALGLSGGYFHATGAALEGDLTTRTGDQSGLRIIPFAVSAIYRADWLQERWQVPFVPFAKAGFDCALWSTSETSAAVTYRGRTLGWHVAAGLAMTLDFIDADAARAMDRESGVNHTAVFVEFTRITLNGFGAGDELRLGDTTWLAGVMLEL